MTGLDQATEALTWRKLGRIVSPDPRIPWLYSHAGPSAVLPTGEDGVFEIYITGRDRHNRSLIGRGKLRLEPEPSVTDLEAEPVLGLGERGAFDENGVSYPCLVSRGARRYLYYVGWVPTILTPFQNHLGLAIADGEGPFVRYSRAPILERTDREPFCTGSAYAIAEGHRWSLWYTSFLRWGSEPRDPKHTYVIKYAESDDGIHWRRFDRIAIPVYGEAEHATTRPSVLRLGGRYHMWYSYRGDRYRLGYAVSKEGSDWIRSDDRAGLPPSADGWDSQEIGYPHVFRHRERLYLLYCGNDFGRAGLGIAVSEIPFGWRQ